MSAEIIALPSSNHAAQPARHSVSAESLAFLGGLLIAMADSMAGRRNGQQMDPCRCTLKMLDLIKEIEQAPVNGKS